MIELGIVSEIRKSVGNLRYEYFIPFEKTNTVLLIDEWENQEALDNHHKSYTMKKILLLREKYNLSMKVYRYINDKENITKLDKQYIKE